jgi:hypothetical protein
MSSAFVVSTVAISAPGRRISTLRRVPQSLLQPHSPPQTESLLARILEDGQRLHREALHHRRQLEFAGGHHGHIGTSNSLARSEADREPTCRQVSFDRSGTNGR